MGENEKNNLIHLNRIYDYKLLLTRNLYIFQIKSIMKL